MKSFQQWMGRLAAALDTVFHSKYVRALEEESARLRAENRALLNSLLGTAGIAPLESPRPTGPPAAPTRRRSWPQIAAEMESTAAGKRTFPASMPAPRTAAPPKCATPLTPAPLALMTASPMSTPPSRVGTQQHVNPKSPDARSGRASGYPSLRSG